MPHPAELRFEAWRERLVSHYEACAKRDGAASWLVWWQRWNERHGFGAHVSSCLLRFGSSVAVDAGEELPAGSLGKGLAQDFARASRKASPAAER